VTEVEDMQTIAGFVIRIGKFVKGASIRVGEQFEGCIDYEKRKCTAANHTSTNALNAGLKQVLGLGVDQKGSLVAADRPRFDFPLSSANRTSRLCSSICWRPPRRPRWSATGPSRRCRAFWGRCRRR